MIWILAAIAFVALGGPAWALKKIRDARDEDADWTEKNTADRTAHKERTARLEAKVDLLERLLSADKKPST